MSQQATRLGTGVYDFSGGYERQTIWFIAGQSTAMSFLQAFDKRKLASGKNGGAYFCQPPEGIPTNEYCGWDISWDYGYWTAIHADYDASYEGPEDGWVNGLRCSAKELADLLLEIDEHEHTKRTAWLWFQTNSGGAWQRWDFADGNPPLYINTQPID